MGTIYPPLVRNVGPRVSVTWTDAILETIATDPAIAAVTLGSPYVSIDAWAGASFNFSVGGTVDLRFGSAGNPLSSVVIPAGPSSAAAVAALINGVHPNGAFVVDGSLKLFDLAYVEVNSLGTVLAEEVGLTGTPTFPMVRDLSVTASPSRRAELSTVADRNDMFSNQVSVPDGANAMALWITTACTSSSPSSCLSPLVLVTFSNGVDLNPTDKVTFELGGVSDPTVQTLPIPEYSLRGNAKLAMVLFDGIPMIGGNPVSVGHPPIELVVPPGATSVRVAVVAPQWTGVLPILPPAIVSAGVNFASRLDMGIFGPFLQNRSGGGGPGTPGPAGAAPISFGLSGVYSGSVIPGSFGDPLVVDVPFDVAEVRISRRSAGLSGQTTVDVLRNGVSIFSGPPPFVLASAGDYAGASSSSFVSTSFGVGDVLDVLLTSVETFRGAPPPFGPEGLRVDVVPVANGVVGPVPEVLRWGVVGPMVAPSVPGMLGEMQRIYQPRTVGTVTLTRTKRGANTVATTKVDILAGPPGGPLTSVFGVNPLPEVGYVDGDLAVSAKTVFASATWPAGTTFVPQLVTAEDYDGMTQGPDGIGVSVYMT